MRRLLLLLLSLPLAMGALPACDDDDTPPSGVIPAPDPVGVRAITTGLTAPIALVQPDDASGRLLVVDQIGLVHELDSARVRNPVPWLDVRDWLIDLDPDYDERGLLNLALHPDFDSNGRLYVYYSAPLRDEGPEGFDHTNVLTELTVGDDGRPDLDSARDLLAIDWPIAQRNGGSLAFGPDGLLYLGLGDANERIPGEPDRSAAQDVTTLFGSILRLDVDASNGLPYQTPADNPFVNLSGADEIWAYGFRNPAYLSFDQLNGTLFVADAGQALMDEISIVQRGGNYGWNVREGELCFNPADALNPLATCATTGPMGEALSDPILSYIHPLEPLEDDLSEATLLRLQQELQVGLAVVGGYVYRGDNLPDRVGQYIFGDWTASLDEPRGTLLVGILSGATWTLGRVNLAGSTSSRLNQFIRGFGQDLGGEIYILSSERAGPSGTTGKVLELVPAALADDDFIPTPPIVGVPGVVVDSGLVLF